MSLGDHSSTEPKHLVEVSKSCPRLDCPNPTIGIAWRGSAKQLQYHCYGCWRKFDYGGIHRSWAKQVPPPNWWLLEHTPDGEAPKLLELESPSRSGPSRKRTPRRPSRRSVAKSSATEGDTRNAVHAAEPSQKRTRRANVNHVINKEGTPAIVTLGDDPGLGITGGSTLPLINVVVTKSNGLVDEELAHPGPGTRTSPTSDNTSDMMKKDLDDLLEGIGGADARVWQSFMSPEAQVLFDDAVQVDNGAGNASVAAAASDNNPIVQGTSDLTTTKAPSTEPQRRIRRSMTITFREFSVPSKTFYYGLQD